MSISKHDEHTRLIKFNPEVIGLDGIVLSTGEANLRNERGVISRQPDNLLFDPSTKTLYNIEYKCNHTISNRHHALIQLKGSGYMLNKVFNEYRVVNLYVTDNFKVEVVK